MSQKLNTICVQGGYTPKNGEPRILPIYQSTTYKYDSIEQMGRLFDLSESGYFYTRLQNPTNDAVAAKICALEGYADLFRSGGDILFAVQYLRRGRSYCRVLRYLRRKLQPHFGDYGEDGH